MITIKIRVYRQLNSVGGLQIKELYRNSVEWNEDITFPFDSTIKVLKMLYPQENNFIEFSVV